MIKKAVWAIKLSLFANIIFLLHCKTAQAALPAGHIKWHPGHYYTLAATGDDYVKTSLNETKDTVLRGIQVRFGWRDLETAEGVYNFTLIDKILFQAEARNKQFVLLFNTKSSSPSDVAVPDYIKNQAKYEGGSFPYNKGKDTPIAGYTAKLWNSFVRDRLIALFAALGNRYNDHPNFEAVGLTETSIGQPINPVSDAQEDTLFNNILAVHTQMRVQFPNTITYQFTNYPRRLLSSFITGLKNRDAALGGPDIFMTDSQLTCPTCVYSFYPPASGIIPLMPSIQHQDYATTSHTPGDFVYQPTLLELYNYGRNNLKGNYLFWTRGTDILPGETLPNYKRVLNFLKTHSPIISDTSKAGGLDPVCPSSYAFCETGGSSVNRAPVLIDPLPGGVPFREHSNTTYTVSLDAFSDPDSDPLTFSATLSSGAALPSWMSFNPTTRVLSGNPPNGTPAFIVRIRATDTSGLSAFDDMDITTPASLTPNRNPVIAVPIPDQSFKEASLSSYTISAGAFTDPDGDPITLSAALSTGAALPAWLSFNSSTRVLSGTPPSGTGDITVRIRAQDSGGLTASDNMVINTPVTLPNRAPVVAVAIPDQSFMEGSISNYTIPAASFSDPDGDALTLSATQSSGAALPLWLSFSPATRVLSGTPPTGAGNITVRVKASDPSGLNVTDDLVISTPPAVVVNQPPILALALPDQSFTEGLVSSAVIPAGSFIDPEGSALTFSAAQSNGNPLPAWLSFNTTTLLFSGTPPVGAGNITVRVKATDPSGLNVTDDFVVATPVLANPNYMKWLPGHYIAKTGTDLQTKAILANLKDAASVKGLQVTYPWSSLESTLGSYNFTDIDKDLALVKAYNKKLSIVIGYRGKVSPTQSSLPNHILNLPAEAVGPLVVPAYLTELADAGHHANFGHTKTLLAFTNLLNALANKYDKDVAVSFIQLSDTDDNANASYALKGNFLDGIIKMNQSAKTAFVHTPLIQNITLPRWKIQDIMNSLTAKAMGFGGPNVFWNAFNEISDPLTVISTGKSGIYNYHVPNAGSLPIGMQVSRDSLMFESISRLAANDPHNLPASESVDKVYLFSVDNLKSNYLVWTYDVGNAYQLAIEDRLKAETMPLIIACPTIYAGNCTAAP